MGHEAQQRLVIVLLGLGLCTVLSIVLAVVSMAAHTQDKEGSTASSKLGKYRRRMLGRVGLPTLCLLLVVLRGLRAHGLMVAISSPVTCPTCS